MKKTLETVHVELILTSSMKCSYKSCPYERDIANQIPLTTQLFPPWRQRDCKSPAP